MKVYLAKKLPGQLGRVLGVKCPFIHEGNRGIAVASKNFGECCGCVRVVPLPEFASKEEALIEDKKLF